MFLRLRSCYRLLHTPPPRTGIRLWHHLSQTPSPFTAPLLRASKNKLPQLRCHNNSTKSATTTSPGQALQSTLKVKFRKEDVRRLFRFAKGEGYIILGNEIIITISRPAVLSYINPLMFPL